MIKSPPTENPCIVLHRRGGTTQDQDITSFAAARPCRKAYSIDLYNKTRARMIRKQDEGKILSPDECIHIYITASYIW